VKKNLVLIGSLLIIATLTYFGISRRPQNNRFKLNRLELLPFASKKKTLEPIEENLAILGRRLFFDSRVSRSGKISCASCHQPGKAWTDNLKTPIAIDTGSRNTPSIYNLAANRWFFWDGRADALWSQALHPIENPHEMGNHRINVLKLVFNDNELDSLYRNAFDDRASRFILDLGNDLFLDQEKADSLFATMSEAQKYMVNLSFSNIGKAIAEFEKSLISLNSKFDLFLADSKSNEIRTTVFNAKEIQGLQIFLGKGNCSLCHSGPNLSDGEFHYIRLKQNPLGLDSGRLGGIQNLKKSEWSSIGQFSNQDNSSLTKNLKESPLTTWGSFKTPSLRNVSLTAPYMHDGRFNTLKEVIDHYSELSVAGPENRYGESIIKPLRLTEYEKMCLISFLLTLEDNKIGEELDN
jgi:cytochrome c peroxidase